MTNEEAIVCVKMMFAFWENTHGLNVSDMEAAKDLVIERLKNPTAHIDRKAWESCPYCDVAKANSGIVNTALWVKEPEVNKWTLWGKKLEYCPICGRPLTEEAWAMLENRLRG